MNPKYLFLAFFLPISHLLIGEIRIVNIDPSNNGKYPNCTGQVSAQAEGTGGPFTVQLVIGRQNTVMAQEEGVNRLTSFSGLCGVQYKIIIYSEKTCIDRKRGLYF